MNESSYIKLYHPQANAGIVAKQNQANVAPLVMLPYITARWSAAFRAIITIYKTEHQAALQWTRTGPDSLRGGTRMRVRALFRGGDSLQILDNCGS